MEVQPPLPSAEVAPETKEDKHEEEASCAREEPYVTRFVPDGNEY